MTGVVMALAGCSAESKSDAGPAATSVTAGDASVAEGGALFLPPPPATPTTEPTSPGNYILDEFSAEPATEETQAEAMAFREKVIDAVNRRGWNNAESLRAAGYQSLELEPEHWVNMDAVRDGRVFDPEFPEFFVVAEEKVEGAMFLAPKLGYEVPNPPGAPFIRWHRHLWRDPVCLLDGVVSPPDPGNGGCAAGAEPSKISPGMAHVWLSQSSDPFSAEMAAHQH